MIKFFKQIRQNQFPKGPKGRYFKYAIGEIVLVVIGILLALSINNWNENRKQQAKISSYLQSLNEEINTNIDIIERGIQTSIRMQKISEYYYNKLITDSPNSIADSTITNFILKVNPVSTLRRANVVLNDFISSGSINFIRDKDLKTRILLLENRYGLVDQGTLTSIDFYKEEIEPHLNQNSDYSVFVSESPNSNIKKANFEHKREAFINNRVLSNGILLYLALLQSVEAKSKAVIDDLNETIHVINNQ